MTVTLLVRARDGLARAHRLSLGDASHHAPPCARCTHPAHIELTPTTHTLTLCAPCLEALTGLGLALERILDEPPTIAALADAVARQTGQ